MLVETLVHSGTKEPFKIDPLAGMGTSILAAMNVLRAIKYRFDYLNGNHQDIPQAYLRYLKCCNAAHLQNSVAQGLVFMDNHLTDLLSSRQPARNHQDAIERLLAINLSVYGLVDDIVSNGLTLGRVCVLLAEIDRYGEDLRAIQADIEAQEATRDIF